MQIFQYGFLEEHTVRCVKITIIDPQHREWSVAIMATKPEFLVAKEENNVS